MGLTKPQVSFCGKDLTRYTLQLHPFGVFGTLGQQIMRFMDAMYVQ